ncbi:protein of unknown function (plasmid) [Vibrio tapetis subsp. tapetis]|uniref:Uncharacterized protein n=2 Tax=Vibrio tapetis TaxID=52443 RepID=A0A2N8ZNI4_9VIBR|nr:protein of unknown function [Vibrio tapetis subsp. tapetis]
MRLHASMSGVASHCHRAYQARITLLLGSLFEMMPDGADVVFGFFVGVCGVFLASCGLPCKTGMKKDKG